MIIYNAGSGVGNMELPLGGSHSLISTASNSLVEIAFVSTGIQIASNVTTRSRLKPWTPVLSGWAHFDLYNGSANVFGSGRVSAELYSEAGGAWIRFLTLSTTEHEASYWDGAAWVPFGTWPIQVGRRTFDIHWDFVEGVIEIYLTKALVASVSGIDLSFMPPIACMGIANSYNNQVTFSQFLVADTSTLFCKVKQTTFNAVGTYQEWTGALANVNEAVDSSATFITADVPNLRATYKAAARNFTGYGVVAVIPMIRSARGGSDAPPRIVPLVRASGVDYEGTPIDLSYGISWDTPILYNNPATGATWTAAEAGDANLEFGVKTLAA